ncbi:MAG: ribulose bisphosphate carboxylase small subunit [Synechococcales bacterium]|nr:ribulose bisphosphate carboxylase small subunit [Synechococcales bacterium]
MTYYIAPRFLDKLAVHITKNYLNLPGVRVPLILGIHGRKGEGKTFQCELAFDRMGIEVVHMSGSELESPDAGDPSRMIRLRYREAAELVRVRGRMAALMINDIDAGAGRFDEGTQYTVNTQLVNGTLMNIADNPTNVQLPGSYDDQPIQRVPIIVTGNDLSTLYAPLVREGRMEKFYWEPDRADRIGIVSGIFAPDGLSTAAVTELVDTFPQQSIDFYSALRSRLYDEQIRHFIHQVGLERISARVVNSKEAAPVFPKPDFGLQHLKEMGDRIVQEQRRLEDTGLVREYNRALNYRQQQSERRSQEPSSNGSSQPSSDSPSFYRAYASPAEPDYLTAHTAASTNGASLLEADILQQVRQTLAQGGRIGIEYADERRFRVNSWSSCTSIEGTEEDVLSHLKACLQDHEKDYVRLVGIDTAAKRRMFEAIAQRPH